MRFSSIVAATIGLVANIANAAPAFTADALEMTSLSLTRVEGGNATLTFTVHDPDPLSNATTTCSGSWAYGSAAWPTGSYDSCKDTSFAWNMASYTSWTDFTIGLEHNIKDPSIGQPPYDHVTNFAKASFNSSTIACSAMGGRESCLQKSGYVLRAPITQTIAKRR